MVPPKKLPMRLAMKLGVSLVRNHALAQAPVGELLHSLQNLGIRIRAGDQFQQVQIARRIEEMRAQEMPAELGEKPSEIWASGMPLVLVERIASGLRSCSTLRQRSRLTPDSPRPLR